MRVANAEQTASSAAPAWEKNMDTPKRRPKTGGTDRAAEEVVSRRRHLRDSTEAVEDVDPPSEDECDEIGPEGGYGGAGPDHIDSE